MHYSAISAVEDKFRLQENSREYLLKPFSIPVPGEQLVLHGQFVAPQNRSGYYFAKAYPKKRIVLHYTAGHLRSDIAALTGNNYHVSVAFVIARDGTIYQLFSSKYWSGHIGKGIGNTQTNNAEDKCTIGIEISNYGWLTKRGQDLETCYSKTISNNKGSDIYCTLNDADSYNLLSEPFREQTYFASYTNEQYDSMVILLRYLTKVYNIERNFMPEPQRYIATEDVLKFNGIVSHINYRKTGKWDIGPAFDWEKLINGVQAKEYKSIRPVYRGESSADAAKEEPEAFFPEAASADEENEPYTERSRNPEDVLKEEGE